MTKEVMVERVAATATYGGAGSAVVFGMTANEIAAYGGLAVAIIGLLVGQAVSIYFKFRHLRLAEQAAKERPDCLTCPDRSQDDD